MERIKIGAVSYLNTKPLIYGLQNQPKLANIELSINYPALVAEQLRSHQIDVGLVPVAIIPTIPNACVISDYCIGAIGAVNSVSIFSEVPLEEVDTLLLDYQSRTSIQLAQILVQHHWQYKQIQFIPADTDYIKQIKGKTAGVVIGDRAMQLINHYPYMYDLGLVWQQFTGLPFVFAAWVANKPLPSDFIKAFNEANALGFDHLDEVIKENFVAYYDLKKYYLEDISYKLDEDKLKGLSLFLNYINPNYELSII